MLALADPDLDNGPRTDRSATMRMCAVSREVRPIGELIRFVVSPQGEVVPDLKRKLPGRGLWLTASRQTVAEAVRRNHFSKGFKREIRAQATLPPIPRLCWFGAQPRRWPWRQGGQVVSGFSKVEGALAEGQAQALIHASDGAADGIRKLDAILRQKHGNIGESQDFPQGFPIINVLTSAELDLALGRSNVIHAALLAGPASKTFLSRCQILVRYRMADDDKTANAARNSD